MLSLVFFGVLPFVWIVGKTVRLLTIELDSSAAFDLRAAFLPAAHHVLEGASPYASLNDPALAHQSAYVYPPFVAFATAPLTAVSAHTAAIVAVLGSLLAVPLLLWVADVRDWRCYGVALCWSPVFNAAQEVNVSIPIALALALAWRVRRSWLMGGASLGCAVAAKLFVWPLLAWPAPRRRRLLWAAIAVTVLLVVVPWAVISFGGLSDYPRLLRTLTRYEEPLSYSISGALHVVGLPVFLARGAALALTVILCIMSLRLGRLGQERRALAAAILAALASTPILWQHYLVLLLVALAVCRPRLSVGWLVPVFLWASPHVGNGNVAQTVLVPLAVAFVGIECLLSADAAGHLVGFARAALRVVRPRSGPQRLPQ
jgi:hypothetical protein